MTHRFSSSLVAALLLVLGALPLRSMGNPDPGHDMARMGPMADTSRPSRLGSVSFDISCKPQVRAEFSRGIALLHSFWLDEAGKSFGKVAAADPDCAMAYWGVAMADLNQVNGGPTDTGVVAANGALRMADKAREKDAREAAYIHAVHLFFDGYTAKDFDVYSKRYTDAMEEVATDYANDLEAQVFYALALINSDPRDDVALINPKKAVAILYPIFRQHPDHPGIAHYIIHASDNPAMAQQGLEAARRYASIAPAAPHALHMPSHIFARLGLWDEDIRSNLASKAAAESSTVHVGAESRLHAMEFLEYAYLQIGHDDEARAILTEGSTVKRSDVDPRYPSYYADVEARYPALFAIETRNWVMAASLQPIEGGDWVSQSQTLLAHAVAAAHLHDAQAVKAAAQSIESLTEANPRMQVGAPRASVPDEIRAWARFSAGDLQGAIGLLRPVADRQGKVGKGEVELPAREMLAEMFFLSGDFSQALQEYQVSLTSDPNRFNALLGAGQAAEGLADRDVAAGYYQILLKNCASANGKALAVLSHPRAVVQEMDAQKTGSGGSRRRVSRS
jgi:tetratricopeptide (TPR) repeat protein